MRGRVLQVEGFIYLTGDTIAAQSLVTLVGIPGSILDESRSILDESTYQELGWEIVDDGE